MSNIKTWHNHRDFYSVDMMIAYLNTHKHPVIKLSLDTFVPQLNEIVWGDERKESGKGWSPMTVVEKIGMKKYQENAERIKEADLSYPIIVTEKHVIIDGYHRLAKAYLEGKKDIKVNVIDDALLRKFLLVKGMDFVKLNSVAIYDILELWNKRFCD